MLLTTRVVEVDNLTVIQEHVDFINTSDRLNLQTGESSRELTVITGRSLVGGLLDLTTGRTLTTDTDLSLELGEFVSVHFNLYLELKKKRGTRRV
jgi:hypothetical protein